MPGFSNRNHQLELLSSRYISFVTGETLFSTFALPNNNFHLGAFLFSSRFIESLPGSILNRASMAEGEG